MAIQRTKIALNAARFPLVSTKGSRAVFVPGLDSAPRTPKAFMGTEDSADYNMAQALYMENVMPLAEGYRSVALSQSVAPLTSGSTAYDQALILRDDNETPTLYVPAGGLNFTYRDGELANWSSYPCSAIWGASPAVGSTNTWETAPVTTATVNGFTFVCYARVRGTSADYSMHYWEQGVAILQVATPKLANVPFDPGTIDGISASNGYLIMWSGLEVAWAAYDLSTEKFDFSLYANGEFTGSGRAIPEDVRGPITAITRLPGGFLIFTTKNTVSATYNAANTAQAWAFKEVANAGGVESVEQLSNVSSLGSVYAYTTTGLQRISLNSAEPAYPEVSDFLSERSIERYSGGTLSRQEYGAELRSKLAVIGNRYLVVSYGAPDSTSYEYAIIIDLMLQRMGKIKVTHVDAFEFSDQSATAGLTYAGAAADDYTSFATTAYSATGGVTQDTVTYAPHLLSFLQSSGAVLLANWSYDSRAAEDAGVIIIGRVQLTRGRNTQLNRIELEGPENAVVRVQPSYDGYTLEAPVTLTPVVSVPGYLIVGTMLDCKNFNIEVTGTFALSTIIFEGLPSGQN